MASVRRAALALGVAGLVGAGCAVPRTRTNKESFDPERICMDVPPDDRAPGLDGLAITRGEVIERRYAYGGFVVEGVGLHVSLGSRSREALEAVLRCRAALGKAREDANDLLAVSGARIRVLRDGDDHAVVLVRSRNIERAKEIVLRARRLMELWDLREEFGDDAWTPPPPSAPRGGSGVSAPGPGPARKP